MEIDEVMKRAHLLEADHGPDGWPAIRMRDVTILRCEILELRAKLSTQQAGVRAVLKAAVELVCAPSWAGVSDEDCRLEQALRDAGFVTPNAELCADGYWCVVCGRHLTADEDGVIVHDDVPHPENMTFDEEEIPQ